MSFAIASRPSATPASARRSGLGTLLPTPQGVERLQREHAARDVAVDQRSVGQHQRREREQERGQQARQRPSHLASPGKAEERPPEREPHERQPTREAQPLRHGRPPPQQARAEIGPHRPFRTLLRAEREQQRHARQMERQRRMEAQRLDEIVVARLPEVEARRDVVGLVRGERMRPPPHPRAARRTAPAAGRARASEVASAGSSSGGEATGSPGGDARRGATQARLRPPGAPGGRE